MKTIFISFCVTISEVVKTKRNAICHLDRILYFDEENSVVSSKVFISLFTVKIALTE